MTSCWPHISESLTDKMRPTASVPPPGGNGTISLTNRFGQAPCALAGRASGVSADAAETASSLRRVSIVILPFEQFVFLLIPLP
jgi:hypothetical protein